MRRPVLRRSSTHYDSKKKQNGFSSGSDFAAQNGGKD
jgi:hypothetical protein